MRHLRNLDTAVTIRTSRHTSTPAATSASHIRALPRRDANSVPQPSTSTPACSHISCTICTAHMLDHPGPRT